MDLSRPIGVVTPTIDADVLALLASSDMAFTGRQVHRVLGSYSQTGVNRVLNRLVHEGIVARTTAGSARTYVLNHDHLQAGAVLQLVRARERLVERLAETMGDWLDEPHFAALYGSAASGQHSDDSDIDLFLVRPDDVQEDDDRWTENLLELRALVARWTGNDCETVEMSTDEVEAAFAKQDPFIRSVGRQMIVLVGQGSYLRRGVQRRLKRPTNG
jgi:hypothetical protein